jgi:hypothetical protein
LEKFLKIPKESLEDSRRLLEDTLEDSWRTIKESEYLKYSQRTLQKIMEEPMRFPEAL